MMGFRSKGEYANRCSRYLVLTVFFFLCLSSSTASALSAPEVAVRQVFGELLDRLADHPEGQSRSKADVREIFNSLLSPHIDYRTLARWILRQHWVDASEQQHTNFIDAFEGYIINTYALALSAGRTINLEVEDNPTVMKNSAVVAANLSIADADAVPLQFRLLQRDDVWLLFDVSFSGVSLAKTFRSDFSYIAKDGGIDAVTSFLLERQGQN